MPKDDQIVVRVPRLLRDRIRAYAEELRHNTGGVEVRESAVLRHLLEAGLTGTTTTAAAVPTGEERDLGSTAEEFALELVAAIVLAPLSAAEPDRFTAANAHARKDPAGYVREGLRKAFGRYARDAAGNVWPEYNEGFQALVVAIAPLVAGARARPHRPPPSRRKPKTILGARILGDPPKTTIPR